MPSSDSIAGKGTMDEEKLETPVVGVHYQRARLYRTVHADGVWAGITPRLEIQFSFFSDLRPMPEFILNKITPEGALGTEVQRVEKEGIIRETEVNIVMSVENTVALIEILQKMLDTVDSAKKQVEARKGTS